VLKSAWRRGAGLGVGIASVVLVAERGGGVARQRFWYCVVTGFLGVGLVAVEIMQLETAARG
jgi:hypothetical protein